MLTDIWQYLQYFLLALYLLVLLVVCIYGFHRYVLVYLYYKHKHLSPTLTSCFRELPKITIQLPMFNERYVAKRVIEQACAVEYPSDRLEIQVLDDSTDDTTEIARETVERMRAEGHDIVLLHRTNRVGFKAGALQEGLAVAKGEFLCIFDADFIPPRDVLLDTVHHFTDAQVAMLQTRWDHVNRDQSVLTQAQAVLLDGHFVMEHGARNRSGRFINFNGTAGIWRKSAIADAGGWQHDTLTEDLDLSYRAQLRGWRFIFLDSTRVPAELPPEMLAFKAQQHRWTKGGAQTCKKLLPTVLASNCPWPVKVEAFFHLTSNVVYLFVTLLSLLLFPAIYLKLHIFPEQSWQRYVVDLMLLGLATFSASTFYIASQRELRRGWWDSIKYIPAIMSLGIGIAINNSRAMLQGFFGQVGEFVRTPKYGATEQQRGLQRKDQIYRIKSDFHWQPWIELFMGFYMIMCLVLSLMGPGGWFGAPFLFLFAAGYLYVGFSSLRSEWHRHRLALAGANSTP
ncbi:MAG: hypothetical protein HJJLKODD_02535 [Phycisphaerae bacterium]|nr:hypothetical protein [Phycisphaerae bacterium]